MSKFKLSHINITEIARVGKPAVTKATFAITKSDDNKEVLDFKVYHPLVKNDVKKQALGPVLIPDEFDTQGHIVSKEEIEKACHTFMTNLAKGDVQGEGTSDSHKIFDKSCNVIECFIDHDGSIAKSYDSDAPAGSWWVAYQFDDTSWKKVEKGEITGFSVGGSSAMTLVPETEILNLENLEKNIVEKVLSGISTKFHQFTKGDDGALSFTQAYTERVNEDKLWDIKSAFNQSLDSILRSDADNKEELVKASLNQYGIKLLAFIKATTTTSDDGVIALSDAMIQLEKVFIEGSEKLINKSTNGGSQVTPEEKKELAEGIVKSVVAEVTPLIEKSKEDITKEMEKSFIKKSDDQQTTTDNDKPVIVKGADGKDINLTEMAKTVTDTSELIKKIAGNPNTPNGRSEEEFTKGDDGSKFAGTGLSFRRS